MGSLTRRAAALAGLAGAGSTLAGCAVFRDMPMVGSLFQDWPREGNGPVRTADYGRVYGPVEGERHRVPAFDYTNLDPAFLRAEVAYAGGEPAGTVVVDPRRRLLYLVEERGRASRYGVAVGPESRGFSGPASVAARRAWPDWVPSPVANARVSVRWAQLGDTAGTVPGGPRSPRGARALYLAVDGQDAGYVIHGTPAPDTVGTEVVTGCIGLINQDMIDLFRRTREGTRAVVLA